MLIIMDQMIEVTLCIYFPTRLDVTKHIVHGMLILEYIIIYFLYFFFRFLLTNIKRGMDFSLVKNESVN